MSLLKRIEEGQGSSSGDSKGETGQLGSGSESSRLSSLQTRRTSAPVTSPQAGTYFDLKTRVQNKLLAELDPSMDISKTDEVKRTIQDLFEQILSEENIVLSRPERKEDSQGVPKPDLAPFSISFHQPGRVGPEPGK